MGLVIEDVTGLKKERKTGNINLGWVVEDCGAGLRKSPSLGRYF